MNTPLRTSLLTRSAALLLGGLALLPALGGAADAQTYLRPDNGARTTRDKQNGFVGGQITDLEFSVASVQFVANECAPGSTKSVLQQAVVTIEMQWTLAKGLFGLNARQAEASGKTADADKWVLLWKNEDDRWVQSSISPSPGVSLTAVGGEWSGFQVTMPEGFENGQSGSQTFTLTLNYVPKAGDECAPRSLSLKGHYVHTYDGDLHVFEAPAVSLSTSFPWGFTTGHTATLGGNNHAWVRPLNDAGKGNPESISTHTVPTDTVSAQGCCPLTGSVGYLEHNGPSYALNEYNDYSPVQRGDQRTCSVFFSDEESGIAYVALNTLATDGGILDSATTSFDPPCFGECEETVDLNLPARYFEDGVRVIGQIVDAAGNVTEFEVPYEVADPMPQVHGLLAAETGDSTGIFLDPATPGASYTFPIEIRDTTPEVTAAWVSDHIFVHLMGPEGTIDLVNGYTGVSFVSKGEGRFIADVNLVEGGTPDWFDNVLNARAGQRIHVVYQTVGNEWNEAIFHLLHASDEIRTYAAEERAGTHTDLAGQALGGSFVTDVDGWTVALDTLPGESAASVAGRYVTAVNAAGIPGVGAALVGGRGIRLDGASLPSVSELDSGLYATVGGPLPVPYCDALPNSTGQPSTIGFIGTPSYSANELILTVDGLPANQNGLFIASPDATSAPLGNGTLCLGTSTLGFVFRFDAINSGPGGSMFMALDLQSQPVPGVEFLPGSNWFIQVWHRDVPAGGAGFNFSPGLDVIVHP